MTRVLVVDDEPTLLELIAEILRDEGYDVLTARDGRAALSTFIEGSLDLVLMDVMMPIMDGPTTFRAMRAHTPRECVPIAMMSAASSPSQLDSTIDSFLPKPFELDHLLTMVSRLAGPP